jgi:hypothetical protein
MARPVVTESLEGRRLFNITVMDFIGSVATGSRYEYDVYAGSTLQSKEVQEVMGASTFNGHSATRIKSVFTGVSTPSTDEKDQYLTVSPSLGALVYGSVETYTDGSYSQRTTTTNDPYEVESPFSLEAGKTYKYVYTEDVETVTGDAKSLTTLQITRHVTLESDSTVKLTTPAGTFNVYVLDVKESSSEGTELVQDYLAPGIGLVKSQTPDQTVVLTNFSVAGTAARGLG